MLSGFHGGLVYQEPGAGKQYCNDGQDQRAHIEKELTHSSIQAFRSLG